MHARWRRDASRACTSSGRSTPERRARTSSATRDRAPTTSSRRTGPSRRRTSTRSSRPRCAPRPAERSRSIRPRSARSGPGSPRSPPTTRTRGRVAYTAEEIAQPAADNRMVVFPYTKRMCANIDVDQGAAVLLCSYEAARAARHPRRPDRVPPRRRRRARPLLHHRTGRARRSAGDRRCGAQRVGRCGYGRRRRRAFRPLLVLPVGGRDGDARAGLGRAPSTGDDRPLTVTGGLGFAGGPVNNYPTHAIARMVEACRADPGSFGLTTALGWYATKHLDRRVVDNARRRRSRASTRRSPRPRPTRSRAANRRASSRAR